VIIRVPLLLQKAVLVIHPLDLGATRAVDPTGEETAGYDDVLNEPVVYTTTTNERVSARRESAQIRIPCQVEDLTDKQLNQMATGDDPITNIAFVLHRKDLEELRLLDNNGDILIKKGDRIEKLEEYGAPIGTTIKTFLSPGLYVHEVRSKSWGFGPTGYDLEIVYTSRRQEAV
jgi:hypothetical protein